MPKPFYYMSFAITIVYIRYNVKKNIREILSFATSKCLKMFFLVKSKK